MLGEALPLIKQYLRDVSNQKGIRISEFFHDFDKLRSGYVSTPNFFRILQNTMRFPLSPEHMQAITESYGNVDGTMIKWKHFINDVCGNFDGKDFRTPPDDKLNKKIYDSSMECDCITEHFTSVLLRIKQFMDYRGISIKECYAQFDTTNIGCVTQSQFFRFFPGPPDIKMDEITFISQTFESKSHPGLIDYYLLDRELNKISERQNISSEKATIDSNADTPIKEANSIEVLVTRLKYTTLKHGIRTMDFFKQFDKLNHDSITPSQFSSALTSAFGKALNLDQSEIAALARFNLRPDGRVYYRNFCSMIDAPFQALNLYKSPLSASIPVRKQDNVRLTNKLSPSDEMRVDRILKKLYNFVQETRIPTQAFFADFDIGSEAVTGYVTDTQMARVLNTFLGVKLSSNDFQLLAEKFRDPVRGLVNYRALCQQIDDFIKFDPDLYRNCPNEDNAPGIELSKTQAGIITRNKTSFMDLMDLDTPKPVQTMAEDVPVEIVMERIRHLVLTLRLNLKLFFQDDDTLRSGRINKSLFIRGLSRAGLSRIEIEELSPKVLQKLCKHYESVEDPNQVYWTKFVNDVDEVFTCHDLEKNPTKRIDEQRNYVRPPKGTVDWKCASPRLRKNYDDAIAKIKRFLFERRMLIKPEFSAFDKNNHGHITVNQFRKLTAMTGMNLSQELEDALITRYEDDHGFNYMTFLNDLEVVFDVLEYAYPKLVAERQSMQDSGAHLNDIGHLATTSESVMQKVKAQVYRKHLRMSEFFRDHDPMNHGTLSRETFRRALGQAPISISNVEQNMLEHKYQINTQLDSHINWRQFCKDMDAAFVPAHGLEKDPLRPFLHVTPPSEFEASVALSAPESKKIAHEGLMKIARQVHQRRTNLKWAFQDFDIGHRETVTPNQFRRVLTAHGLADFVTQREWRALEDCFRHSLGVSDDVNYGQFMRDIDSITDKL